MSFHKKGRNFRTKTGITFPISSDNIAELDVDDFSSVISETLRVAFGEKSAAVKSLMRITGANDRTVKNWLQGKNAPNGENLVELVRHSDEVLEAFLWMSQRDEILAMKKLMNARDTLIEMIGLIDQLINSDLDESD
jgi:hypothetical protein